LKILISNEVFQKLKSKFTSHPKEYKVSWLQNGHRITVREKCLINFYIGGYSEITLFDVFPMYSFIFWGGHGNLMEDLCMTQEEIPTSLKRME